jgi:methylated-DNA-[protein]-cysteine S-methyltransferase
MKKFQQNSYALFESPIGTIGLSWTSVGISRLQLPEASEKKTATRLISGMDQPQRVEAPVWVGQVIKKIQQHLLGNLQDLRGIRLDVSQASPFYQRVYQAALDILPGMTKTYGEIAKEILSPRGARAVGQALGRNPIALIIPCHRVLAANGGFGGFSAHGGVSTKRKLLQLEGVDL